MKSNHVNGNNSSICPMSLENRLRILPTGLVSKNRIGHRIIVLNIALCRDFAADIRICLKILTSGYSKHYFNLKLLT